MLGQGAYAMVREAVHTATGFVVAVKIYDKYKLNTNAQTKKSVQREIKMLSLVTKSSFETVEGQDFITTNEQGLEGHPSIMKLYDAIDTHRHLYLIIERCKGSMLQTIVREYGKAGARGARKNLPEEVCAKIYYQIAMGMAYYHTLNISHRDIKLENILVDMDSPNFQTKIIDFGFATQTSSQSERLRAFCGTPAYMSP